MDMNFKIVVIKVNILPPDILWLHRSVLNV